MKRGITVYLILALFWLVLAVVLQIFWETLREHAYIPVDRSIVGFVCFVLFSYNFIRWRMARVRAQAYEQLNAPPPPRPHREYDPTFDFSDPQEKKSEPEA
jgi:hypothetical protein